MSGDSNETPAGKGSTLPRMWQGLSCYVYHWGAVRILASQMSATSARKAQSESQVTAAGTKDLLETLQVFAIGLALVLYLPHAWMMVLVAANGTLFFCWGRGLERQRQKARGA